MRLFSFNSHAPCWLKVRTQAPECVYFFGPFNSSREARDHQDGYITDLVREGARDIRVTLQNKEPQVLTLVKGLDR